MELTPEAEAMLQDLKKYLSSTPVLVAPKPQELLLLYLAVTNQVVNAALVARREVDGEASLESISITVGKQITVEQLTELSIVMRISRYDHVYRHHVRDK